MKTKKDEIFDRAKVILVELFELDEEQIVPEAKLFEDLDIDSIDVVDMMIELKKFGSATITPEHFKHVKTLQDVVDVLASE